MFDTIAAYAPISDLYSDGDSLRAINQHGEIEYTFNPRRQVKGKHGTKLTVKAKGNYLYISGSYAKFLQGHKVFGSSNLINLCCETFYQVTRELDIPVSKENKQAWESGLFRLQQLDYAQSYQLESPEQVQQWIRAALATGYSRWQTVHPERNRYGTSLYMGLGSDRSLLRIYGKGAELNVPGHHLPARLERRDDIMAFAASLLRVEASLKSRMLKEANLDTAARWLDPTVANRVLEERKDHLQLYDVMRLEDDVAQQLPQSLRFVYTTWRSGENMRAVSGTGFKRYRRMLKGYGIDIAQAPFVVATERYLLGAPLKSFITGAGVEPPDWARKSPLLACA